MVERRDFQITAGANSTRETWLGALGSPVLMVSVTASRCQSQKIGAKNNPPQQFAEVVAGGTQERVDFVAFSTGEIWQALRRYIDDGRLMIDNDVSERTLRHQAVGRRNWLFLGNEAAGPRAAVLYTILAGAKRHRIEPWAYVGDLLLRLHADDSRLEDMLPDRWAAAHPEAILSHRLHESRTKAIRTRARRAHRRARAR